MNCAGRRRASSYVLASGSAARANPLATIRSQIESRTRQAFGKTIWPHLFRDCAVTELVDCAPEEIGIAPLSPLGHAALETTRKHYIQAQGMTAHRVQELIAARRRAASGRRSPGA
jgi:integrase/recombinase XerD